MSSLDVSSGAVYAGRDANHALSFRQFTKSKHAQYFTPVWLADLLCTSLQAIVPPEGPATISVLDPTCGSGRLLAPWKLAGAPVLVGVGAPTSLAVRLAADRGLTLCGFARGGRVNVYTRRERVSG